MSPQPSEFYGLSCDDVLARIENGESIAAIAQSAGKTRAMLSRWLRADEDRSVRAREAREAAAAAWDEKAETAIEDAADPFELARAKELAHHYRWKASKIAPREYGDRQHIEHSGAVSIADVLRAAKEGRKSLTSDDSERVDGDFPEKTPGG